MGKNKNIKSAFEEYFTELIGVDNYEQFSCAITGKDTRRGLRVNTLRVDKEFVKKWLSTNGYSVSDSEFSVDGIEISGRGQPLSLKLPYHAGFTYPQDPSSMFAVELLDPQPGEFVCDLTAAPGGKSSHIAQRMKNTGVLLSNDMDTRRLKALHSNFERLGIWNAVVTRMSAHKLSLMYTEKFDRILLDPSCSGEGLLVTGDGKPNYWSKKALKRYSAEQFGLLCSAFRMLKVGGRLVYSTCTLNKVEDDDVVLKLLEKFPEAKIDEVEIDVPRQLGDLLGVRFWPQITNTKGFFCIAITKTESVDFDDSVEASHKLDVLKEKQVLGYRSFMKKQFGIDLPDTDFVLRDNHLFVVCKDMHGFDLPPWYSLSFPLFKVYEKELRPTHAGALWIGMYGKENIYELSRDEVEKVFERQVVENTSGKQGLYVSRFEKFPLGITKLTDKKVEVLLPRQY